MAKKIKMTKSEMIREIALAINASAAATAGTNNATKKYDGDMFLALAFRSEKELEEICKKTGIKTTK